MIMTPLDGPKPLYRTFIFRCVTCGLKEAKHVKTKVEVPPETIDLVRCDKCTRRGVRLPPLSKKKPNLATTTRVPVSDADCQGS